MRAGWLMWRKNDPICVYGLGLLHIQYLEYITTKSETEMNTD